MLQSDPTYINRNLLLPVEYTKYSSRLTNIDPLPHYASNLALEYFDNPKHPDDIYNIKATTNKRIRYRKM